MHSRSQPLLTFARHGRAHVATSNGRAFVVTRLGPKRFDAQVVRISHEGQAGACRQFRTLRAAKRWLAREAASLARRLSLGHRTPIMKLIAKGERP